MSARTQAALNIRPADHARFKSVADALGIKHIDAAAEALNAWADAHELEAVEAMATRASKIKKGGQS